MKPPIIVFARPPKRVARIRMRPMQPANLPTVVRAYSPATIARWTQKYGSRWKDKLDSV